MKRKITAILLVVALAVSLGLVPAVSVGAAPDPGIVGLWHFDEGTGATASDSSGNGNDGTLSGGKFGNALSFDGSSGYVTVSDDPTLDPGSALTVEAWIYLDSYSTSPAILSNAFATGNNGGYQFIVQSDGDIRLIVRKGGSSATQTTTNQPVATGGWHHIAGVYDGSTQNIDLYYDGVEQTSANDIGTIPTSIDPATQDMRIGATGHATPQQYFDGLIDEVRISNVVRASFVLTSPPSVDGNTVALWRFDESVGLTAEDETANNNDGTINGASWAGPTWTSGMFDGALSFDGSDDYVSIAHSASLDISDVITVEAWIYANSLGSQAGIIRKGLYPTDLTRSWGLDIQSGKARFFIYDGGTAYIAYSDTVSTGAWHHLVGTYDGLTVNIYLDGDNTSSTPAIHTGDIDTNTNPIIIGKRNGGYFFDGIIDEVRIWDTATPSFNLGVSPQVDFNPVLVPPVDHTVTATVTIDKVGDDVGEAEPAPGVEVSFEVSMTNTASGTDYTDTSGQAEFEYAGAIEGEDCITVSIDLDWCQVEPKEVYKFWLEHFVTGGGKLNGSKKVEYSFAGTVGNLEDDSVGQFQIVDHTVKGAEAWHCNNDFLHLVFGGVPTQSPSATKNFATFEGQFTSNRGGSKLLRVTITDVDEPGTGNDTIDVQQWNHSIQDFEPWFGTGEEEGIDGGNFQVHDYPSD